MRHQRGETEVVVAFLIVVALLILLIGGGLALENWACKSKWERSGMAGVTWGPVQGCLVKLPDGRWLPEERIREIEIPKSPQS